MKFAFALSRQDFGKIDDLGQAALVVSLGGAGEGTAAAV